MEGLGFIPHLLFLDILVAPPQILVWIYVLVQSVFGDVFTGALCMLLYVTKMSGVQPGPPAVLYRLCTCISMAAAQLLYLYHQSSRAGLGAESRATGS